MAKQTRRKIEVCLSPALFPYRSSRENSVVVVVDILRATTSMVTAFDYGVKHIIPLADIEEAKKLKEDGYLVAAEQDGLKPGFADFGNGAFEFMTEHLKDKTIGFSTTNGTKALKMADCSGNTVLAGAFINLEAVAEKVRETDRDVIILCSGWKNQLCIEDTLFAGALAEMLLSNTPYQKSGDAVDMAQAMWRLAKDDLAGYMNRASHMSRLRKLGQEGVLEYTISFNKVDAVPVYNPDKGWLYNIIRK